MGMDALTNTGAVYQQSRPVAPVAPASSTSIESTASYADGQPLTPVPGTAQYVFNQQKQSEGHADFKGRATDDEIMQAIASANRRAHFGHASAEFSYHEPTKRISVKIIDKDTNEVIREIPPEETLEMISKMWELAGIMVDERR